MGYNSSEENDSFLDLFIISGFSMLIFVLLFVFYFYVDAIGKYIRAESLILDFNLIFISFLSIAMSLMILYLKENLEIAKKAAYIFLILGFFISTSLAKSGFFDFLMRSVIGILVIMFFNNFLYPKLIPYKLDNCSRTQFKLNKRNIDIIKNKLKIIDLEKIEDLYEGYILNCETRIKFIKDGNVAVIAFEVDKRKIIKSIQSDVVLSWIRNFFNYTGRSATLPQEIINDMLSDYLETPKLERRFIMPVFVVFIIFIPLITFGKQIISFLDAHQWVVTIIVVLIAILREAYNKFKHEKEGEDKR